MESIGLQKKCKENDFNKSRRKSLNKFGTFSYLIILKNRHFQRLLLSYFQEHELAQVQSEIEKISRGDLEDVEDEELLKLQTENVKLKHRVSILKRVNCKCT